MSATARITVLNLDPPQSSLHKEVLNGLSLPQKTLPCKLFYDEQGSQLYQEITRLEEYYPTRAEALILRTNIDSIRDVLGRAVCLIEYGSGNSEKTRILLEHLDELSAYVPIDISREHLIGSAKSIANDFPDLEVLPVFADFSKPMRLPTPRNHVARRVVFFPGSTIGNFHPSEAAGFIAGIGKQMGEDGGLLIGVDIPKSKDRLELAYDDSKGITAAFNLNMLTHINRVIGADFDPRQFGHRAVWNESESRVEMHLVSKRAQTVKVDGRRFNFQPGESIWTESSYKYSLEHFAEIARMAGLRVQQVWQDPEGLFSVQLLIH